MDWLNYHHLHYFWMVVRHNSVTRASQALHLSQPTVSAQVHQLENALKAKLLVRQRRGMKLTEVGRSVYRYADEIFALGRELQEAVAGHEQQQVLRLAVGVADVVPKLVAQKLLIPLLAQENPIRVVCRENRPERLLTELSLQELDLVLADTPAIPAEQERIVVTAIEECGVCVFGSPSHRRAYAGKFPRSLDGAPMLLPTTGTMLRSAIDRWFFAVKIQPRVIGEFDDSALLKAFGQKGIGLFVAPAGVEKEICRQFGVVVVGRIESIRERFYIMVLESRIEHPPIAKVLEVARRGIWEKRSRS
jgi:LysR family transcriptional activator of nhaA